MYKINEATIQENNDTGVVKAFSHTHYLKDNNIEVIYFV